MAPGIHVDLQELVQDIRKYQVSLLRYCHQLISSVNDKISEEVCTSRHSNLLTALHRVL